MITLMYKLDMSNSEFTIPIALPSNQFNMIRMVTKHISYDIVVQMEVNLVAKTSQNAKIDPMCKIRIFPNWQKAKFIVGQTKSLVCSK